MAESSVAWEPEFLEQVKSLVDAHRRIKDEPLLLAVYFAPNRNARDVFVFEVIDNFGSNSIESDQELFEVSFGSTDGFPLEVGRKLRLILTNPLELMAAARDRWATLLEVREAIRDGRAEIIWQDPGHPELMEQLRG